MNEQPVLSREQWQLVQDMLEQERLNLRQEIHHTDKREVREDLQQRFRLIETIIDQIKHTATVAG